MYAARHAGVPCQIFVPATASIAKTEASRAYGASVAVGGAALDEAVAAARAHAADAGCLFVHPFDDPVVIAGQATLGVELAEDVDGLRQVVVPLGGGGLASGVAIAVKRRDPSVRGGEQRPYRSSGGSGRTYCCRVLSFGDARHGR